MTNKNTKDDMPVNIWVGTMHETIQDIEILRADVLQVGINDEQYTNTEYLKKMIEGMKRETNSRDVDVAIQESVRNQALDDVLKLLER